MRLKRNIARRKKNEKNAAIDPIFDETSEFVLMGNSASSTVDEKCSSTN